MAKVRSVGEFSIRQGDWDDGGYWSCCGIAGSYGWGSCYFRVEVDGYICVLDNDDVYITFKSGGWIGSGDPQLWHSWNYDWWCYFVHDIHSFSINPAYTSIWDAGVSYTYMGDMGGKGSWGWSGDIWMYVWPTASKPTVGSTFNSSGWLKCRGKVSDWEMNSARTEAYYYISFPVSNNDVDINGLTIYSTWITVDPEFLDPVYYPGEILTSSGNWSDAKSCNRSGGYFKHMRSNTWKDRKNKTGDTSFSTVYLHNGTNFSKIAPKLRKE